MTTNIRPLEPIANRGSLRGLANLFAAELSGFWKTRKWWVQSLIWLLICNGILALTLWAEGDSPDASLVPESVELYTIFVGLFGAIGISINTQSTLIGEKREGQAEWILSKPVTRAAYILSKLAGKLVNLTAIIIVLQGLVAFWQISAASGVQLNALNFALGTGALVLHGWFYLTLTLMLGAVFNSRLPVIGIPMALIMFQQFFIVLVPDLIYVLPTVLAIPLVDTSIAGELINGVPLTVSSPLFTTPAFSLLFVVIAVWRFSREEF